MHVVVTCAGQATPLHHDDDDAVRQRGDVAAADEAVSVVEMTCRCVNMARRMKKNTVVGRSVQSY